jgi:hypothetical protein
MPWGSSAVTMRSRAERPGSSAVAERNIIEDQTATPAGAAVRGSRAEVLPAELTSKTFNRSSTKTGGQ